jgi:nucleotidyltransferase/DNA polymerase involved in DNA repair
MHVDMDAFFASVEEREHPELKGRPVIVGSSPRERGVVSTCNYEARKFGVRSAMPSRSAFSKCPHAVFIRPHMKLYAQASREVFAIFDRYTPYVEKVSVDEAFLDISGSTHLFGGAEALAENLRATVKRECRLTCSAGVAPNRLLAKIGSEQRKPDGLFMMPFEPDAIREFLAPKPVGVLWGVGKTTRAQLAKYGIATCGDIQRMSPVALSSILGEAAGKSVYAHAFGLDGTKVAHEPEPELTVSREWTFLEDCSDRETVRRKLLELVAEVGERTRREKRWAKLARIKLRDSDFNTTTRQMPFASPARDDIAFRQAMISLFDSEWPVGAARILRLVGFGVGNFTSEPEEDLFGDEDRRKRERLSETLDSIRRGGEKFSAPE